MSADHLPIRPDLHPGESADSYTRRTSHANGLAPRRGHDDARRIDAVLQAQVRDLTLDRYPGTVTGNTRPGPRRGWRLPADVTWQCPTCTTSAGLLMRDWALACHPICTRCGSLLRTGDDTETGFDLTVPDSVLGWQYRVAADLERAPRNPVVAERFRTNYQYATLIALTIDTVWPPIAEPDHRHVRDHALATGLHRTWHHQPATDPIHALAVAIPAFVAGWAGTRHRTLAAEGWSRIAQSPELAHLVQERPGWLPPRPVPRKGTKPASVVPEYSRRRLALLSAELDTIADTLDLNARHVPAMLLKPGERLLPPPGAVNHRRDLAVALHTMLSPRNGTRLRHTSLSATDLDTGRHAARVLHHLDDDGISSDDLSTLLAALILLVDENLIDYNHRRHTLRPALRASSTLTRSLARTASGHTEHLLALWAWVDSTLGIPAGTSSHGITQLRDLDSQLDPQTRWQLRAHVENYLTPGEDLHPDYAEQASVLRRRTA